MIAFGGGDGGPSNACFQCHGFDGQGALPGTPRLAGLEEGYILKQLGDYATGVRPDDIMGPVARQLDHGDRRAVARWYAEQPARSITLAGTASSALGERIYRHGLPSRGVQACAACHGADARGRGLAYPALAGQPAAYTAEQLKLWKTGKRRNDPRGMMSGVSRRLEQSEIDAVSAWLAAQRP